MFPPTPLFGPIASPIAGADAVPAASTSPNASPRASPPEAVELLAVLYGCQLPVRPGARRAASS